MDIVGERIKTLREGAGLSQAKVAAMLNTKQSAIFRYENNVSEMPYAMLVQYADYFDVSLAFNGLLPLIVRGVSRVNDALHSSLSPESMESSASLNLACMAEVGSKHISINCFNSGLSACVCGWYSYSFPWG